MKKSKMIVSIEYCENKKGEKYFTVTSGNSLFIFENRNELRQWIGTGSIHFIIEDFMLSERETNNE